MSLEVDVLLRSSAALSIHRVGVQNWEPLVEAEAVPLDRLFNLTRRPTRIPPCGECAWTSTGGVQGHSVFLYVFSTG